MKSTAATSQLLISSTVNIKPFIDYCQRHKLDWQALAKECRLPLDLMATDNWLPTRDLLNFIAAIDRHYGYQVAIDVGRLVTVRHLSVELDEKLDQCQSLIQGISTLIDEMPQLSNHVTIWVERFEQQCWLCHRSAYRPTLPGFEQAEWFRTLALINFCRKYLGQAWRPDKAKLISSDKNQDRLPIHFKQSEIQFGYLFGAISIDLNDDYPLHNVVNNTPNWHDAMVKLIRTYATLPWFSIEWFADRLGMTSRTLQRNLKQKDITFKDVKEQTKRDTALALLADAQYSIDDIAWQVGYNDLSNFNRAFKKWTGTTAPAYRRSLIGN
ncbi:AraC family transcriptional regulator [Thalassotalea sp. HSM 43]|uniref:helix-turn-helix domain-containing protein n=1 Tax=Thalassotalea sp. HSM 43 TaxID=2552945 RepID=UPI0010810D52|nr:helix-turn-helix transcriptional regulator [Thalassotalea sp. HSM 43]QBY05234.1 AraC family transcriptional regulator [Thalassotalea sp. HSM 43]